MFEPRVHPLPGFPAILRDTHIHIHAVEAIEPVGIRENLLIVLGIHRNIIAHPDPVLTFIVRTKESALIPGSGNDCIDYIRLLRGNGDADASEVHSG